MMRMPSASPERPAGAWLYVRRIVSGWAHPRPRPSRNATSASSEACDTSGTMRKVAPAMKSEAVRTPVSPMRLAAVCMPIRTMNAATA